MNVLRPVRPFRIVLALLVAGALSGCAHIVMLHDPLTASEHNDLGVAYESSGELDLAAKEYRKALRLDPHDARARVNLGNVEAANGRWGRAEACYRRALRDAPADYDAMNNLAVALLRQGRRLDEARALAERALAAGTARASIYRATLAEVDSGLCRRP
jgi:Flp pilus assembly protein TadD